MGALQLLTLVVGLAIAGLAKGATAMGDQVRFRQVIVVLLVASVANLL